MPLTPDFVDINRLMAALGTMQQMGRQVPGQDDRILQSQGQVGKSFLFPVPPVPGEPGAFETLVNVTGDDTRGQIMTVAMSTDFNLSTPAAGDDPRPIARIRFGQGRTQHQIMVDVRNGTVLNLPGSHVRVDMAMSGAPNRPHEMAAHVVYGPIAGAIKPRLTVPFDVSLAFTSFVIPEFATDVHVLKADPTLASLQLDFAPLGGGLNYRVIVPAGTQLPAGPSPIPISGDTLQLSITLIAGANGNGRAIFELDI